MNCANHPQNAVAAYCRTCGKPICNQCTRQVMGVIYCENCLAEKVSGTAPAPGAFQPAPGYQPAIRPASSGPNPALAGILAGFFPFGVGAVYCGLYAKGLAHFIIATLLIVGQINATEDIAHVILGLCMTGFYFYQLIDAVKSAKALQMGQPAPDPFGLATMFSPGPRPDFSARNVPTGAVILIGLGVLFLLHNLGLWFLRPGVVLSLALIALGVWIYVRRLESPDQNCRRRGMVGPAVLVTLGAQLLLDSLNLVSFWRTLPALLIAIGIAVLVQRSTAETAYEPQPPGPSGVQAPVESAADPAHSTEVKNG